MTGSASGGRTLDVTTPLELTEAYVLSASLGMDQVTARLAAVAGRADAVSWSLLLSGIWAAPLIATVWTRLTTVSAREAAVVVPLMVAVMVTVPVVFTVTVQVAELGESVTTFCLEGEALHLIVAPAGSATAVSVKVLSPSPKSKVFLFSGISSSLNRSVTDAGSALGISAFSAAASGVEVGSRSPASGVTVGSADSAPGSTVGSAPGSTVGSVVSPAGLSVGSPAPESGRVVGPAVSEPSVPSGSAVPASGGRVGSEVSPSEAGEGSAVCLSSLGAGGCASSWPGCSPPLGGAGSGVCSSDAGLASCPWDSASAMPLSGSTAVPGAVSDPAKRNRESAHANNLRSRTFIALPSKRFSFALQSLQIIT